MSDRTPYVVRSGPWARNLYLGLPAAFAFALIGYVSEMPWWFAAFWFGVIAVLVGHLAVQSYSAGAHTQPTAKVLVPKLVELTGLPFSS